MTKEAAETLLFERETLYEEIWAEPMVQVAKRCGISDVGLAKICKKMSIPRPPRGYWAKKSHGVNKREPLRPATVQTQTMAVVERIPPSNCRFKGNQSLATSIVALTRKYLNARILQVTRCLTRNANTCRSTAISR